MKSTLRESMLNQRLALLNEQKKQWDASLILQLISHDAFKNAHTIGLFHPIKNEPNLLSIVEQFPTKHFLLPVVHGTSMAFHSYSFQGQTVPLLKSDLNILEPKHSPTFHKNLDLLIVPGLAFTRSGYRLGFGKGFFDAYLQHNRPRHVIGVLYPFQLVTTMPLDAHDQIVDGLLIAN